MDEHQTEAQATEQQPRTLPTPADFMPRGITLNVLMDAALREAATYALIAPFFINGSVTGSRQGDTVMAAQALRNSPHPAAKNVCAATSTWKLHDVGVRIRSRLGNLYIMERGKIKEPRPDRVLLTA